MATMVTMAEIDRAREALLACKIIAAQDDLRFFGTSPSRAQLEVDNAEAHVEALLRQWRVQGCREVVTSASELEEMLTAFGNVKFDLGAMRVDGDEGRAEAKRLKALILGTRVMSEAQCVAADVLASRDAITKERDDWKAKYDALNRHRADQEKEIERLKRVHAQNTQGLQRALETVKADRNSAFEDREVAEREIARLKDLGERMNFVAYRDGRGPSYKLLLEEAEKEIARLKHEIEKRDPATLYSGSIPPPKDGTPYATHGEVRDMLERALEEHYKRGHPLD